MSALVGGDRVGLGEFLFIGEEVNNEEIITPTLITQTQAGYLSGFDPIHLIDGVGLSATPTVSNLSTVTHADVYPTNFWATNTYTFPNYFNGINPEPQFVIDIGGQAVLTSMVVWGYGGHTNEASNFKVEFSTDSGATYTATELVMTSQVLANGNQKLDFSTPRTANRIRLTITKNAAGNNYEGAINSGDRVGLGEIRFIGQLQSQVDNNFHVFVLMGQSNMAGFAATEAGDESIVPNVLKIPTIGSMNWVASAHPLHNRLSSDRFGLGLPFASKYIVNNPGVNVGLIPVAFGGAPISQLNKGTAVYNDALEKIQFAVQTGVLKGILWHQGENDTVSTTLANGYQAKLDKLVDDIRADSGIGDLPFVVGNLAEFYGTGPDHNAPARVALINTVRTTLTNLPSRKTDTGFVSSTGLSAEESHQVHFNRASLITLGKRYADKIEEMNGQ